MGFGTVKKFVRRIIPEFFLISKNFLALVLLIFDDEDDLFDTFFAVNSLLTGIVVNFGRRKHFRFSQFPLEPVHVENDRIRVFRSSSSSSCTLSATSRRQSAIVADDARNGDGSAVSQFPPAVFGIRAVGHGRTFPAR